MSDDELFYLQPGFDLTSLTVPRIRAILVSHDISYPASAKKPQLIQILTNEVLPHSRKLLRARERIRRTSRGITDVPSSQESSTVDDEDDRDLMPPPPRPARAPRARKSNASPPIDDAGDVIEVSATPAVPKRTRTSADRTSTTKHPRASDTETDAERAQPSARKTRKSIPGTVPVITPPSANIGARDLPVKNEAIEDGDSPFTDDNPFQSGSSPASASKRGSSTSRTRRSLGAPLDRKKSAGGRRQTTSPNVTKTRQDGEITAPSRSTFEFPVARVKSETGGPGDVETTEEFTPEEQLELVRDRAANGFSSRDQLPVRSSALTRRRAKPASTAAKTGPWIVILGIVGAFGALYRQEKVAVGYCGVGEPSWSLASNPQIPVWITDQFAPTCEPCPQHAFCYSGMEVTCENDFVLKQHPLSLNGLIPLPPTCEPDGEKVRKIKAVANKAIEELRERRAVYECGNDVRPGDGVASNGEEPVRSVVKNGATRIEIAEEDLKKEVSKMKRKGMSDQEFEDLWRGALGDIIEREEIQVTKDGSGRAYLSSTSLARLPLACAIRRSLLLSISRNRLPIGSLIFLASIVVYLRSRIISYRQATAQIPTLVATTLDRLATQAALSADGRVDEAFISIGQLRDDVLRATFSPTERERVWKGVRAIVEGNSNVRTSTREGGRTGEWSRVWEWIGPVNLVPELEDRKSAGMIQNHAAGKERERPSSGEMVENRKWDEGRPIY